MSPTDACEEKAGEMTELVAAGPVFALLTDGTQVEIRALRSEDVEAVTELHRGMSDENLYLRFFSFDRAMAERSAERICRAPGRGNAALGAWLSGELVGAAGYEWAGGDVAEVSLAVADEMHHRGIGTLLLEHLGSLARANGVRAFHGDTLVGNGAMLRVFADAGMAAQHRMSGGVVEVEMRLAADEHYLDAVAERERQSTVASLEPMLRPGSVAVVGASRRAGAVGNALLRNLRGSAFAGPVYAVNPRGGDEIEGVPCVTSVAELPVAPDLAVLAVPASAVAQAARECGQRGARALLVVTSGLSAQDAEQLIQACHRYGMRLAGPNCLGIAVPSVNLDATFAPHPSPAGAAGVVVQSGGVGIALLEHLARLDVGVSSFASVGDKYDVSANDLLMWWDSDERTRLGILHLESFGNPRKFARTARRVGRRMPLLTVLAGRSESGQRAAASHTAAVATPGVTRRALFAQAGIVATDDLGELVEAAALLARQPYPRGPRVAIVSNAGGAGVLAADACADAGLTVPELGEETRRRLADLLPPYAALGNPIDTTAAVTQENFRAALEWVAAAEGVDAVMAIVVPTALGDLEVGGVAADVPVAAVVLGQAEAVTVHDGVPTYAFPENAARALAHTWSYGRWRTRPPGLLPTYGDLREEEAKGIIDGFLQDHPDGGWLAPVDVLRLLDAYGLPLAEWRWAQSEDAAVYASQEVGGHVALKAHVPGLVHKTEAGALQLNLRGDAEVRQGYRRLAELFGDALEGVLVQTMVDTEDGVEVLCGVVQEPVFGPLIVFGLGGVATEALGDRTARLAPLTDTDAADLIMGLRATPLLLGHRGRPAADLPALTDALLRLSSLAADHPGIAELDLNPLIAGPGGAIAVDARVRLVPYRPWDPYLRRLR
jgi:acyl-CoA synthetase (NDP forming)/N-acetylglutamate synthase-like GNAT family acetyltransferase